MSVMEKIKSEHSVKISGVMLMFIANALKERQLSILRALAEAVEGGDFKEIDEIGNAAMANEIVGQKMMDLIEDMLGKEDFEKFLEGKLDVETPSFMPSTGTVN